MDCTMEIENNLTRCCLKFRIYLYLYLFYPDKKRTKNFIKIWRNCMLQEKSRFSNVSLQRMKTIR